MKSFPSKYIHSEVETKWQKFWQDNQIYSWNHEDKREDSFVIDTPPPTVSGVLHMGHIFSYTQADIIARFQRMKGKNVYYPMGFDDNGLPTERLVEKVKKIRAVTLPRAEFIEMCKEVVIQSENEFRELFKSVALSVDWSQEYQTISDKSKTLSQMSFLDLLQKGEAYRKNEPVLWDPSDQTALSQADIEDIEMSSSMNYIEFTTEQKESFIIATTRPELLPACVAIFCHPNDTRYSHLVGKKAITPVFSHQVPIMHDDTVDQEKGSGIVMCCTFGDTNDVYWWKKHHLDTKILLDKSGRILELDQENNIRNSSNANYLDQIARKKTTEARKIVIEILEQEGKLIKQEEIKHSVKCAERSKTPLEIIISPQWFVKVLDKKNELLQKTNECQWHPHYMKERLEIWIKNLNWDWCISRQRFFGVPFPVWYSLRKGEEGKVITPNINELPIDPTSSLPKGYTKEEVIPDTDVMDTWATSSISPQLNSQAINNDLYLDLDRHQKLFPADLRPQAHEIIRTWSFTTIVKSFIHQNSIPWKNLMISGWCLAADKTKMSKSKGNVVTPVDLIREKGADIVRYWTSNSKLGADISYSEDMFSNGNRLINKLWNAAKFAQIHLSKMSGTPTSLKQEIENNIIFHTTDLWIISKLTETVKKVEKEFLNYEYAIARLAAENFFWKDFCDNYLEIVKVRAYNEDNSNQKGQQSSIFTIYHCLKSILLIFAPIIPHITEEIHDIVFNNGKSIHGRGSWPNIADYNFSENAANSGNLLVEILEVVRKIKAENQLSMKVEIKTLYISSSNDLSKFLVSDIAADLQNVTNALSIDYKENANIKYYETESHSCKVGIAL